jgi:fluoride exporter
MIQGGWVGLVALGSGIGGLLRYLMADLINHFVRGFPLATLIINILGSFFMGIFFVLCAHSVNGALLQALLMAGLLGGFTTFSSFSLEAISLLEEGKLLLALIYVVVSVMFSVAGVYLGWAVMHR